MCNHTSESVVRSLSSIPFASVQVLEDSSVLQGLLLSSLHGNQMLHRPGTHHQHNLHIPSCQKNGASRTALFLLEGAYYDVQHNKNRIHIVQHRRITLDGELRFLSLAEYLSQ